MVCSFSGNVLVVDLFTYLYELFSFAGVLSCSLSVVLRRFVFGSFWNVNYLWEFVVVFGFLDCCFRYLYVG